MHPIREKIEYGAVAGSAFILRWIPLWLARLKADAIGLFMAKVLRLRKAVAVQNLTTAFADDPKMTPARINQVYCGVWKHFLRIGIELLRLPRLNRKLVDQTVRITGLEHIIEALEKGKGCICVSGHLGNWEWMGAAISMYGIPTTYVVTYQSNRMVERWMNRMRESAGIEIVERNNALRGVLSALKRNRGVAILCDQDAHEAGVFVPFFGRLASTPRGPAIFHLKTGAPIIFASATRETDGIYQITIEPMCFDLCGDMERDTLTVMADITARLEAKIREYPEQWLWLHKRWKSSPATIGEGKNEA